MFGWFKKRAQQRQARELASAFGRALSARYDAAQTTDENSRHWANADAKSANASNDPEVRRKLRNRARYEYANNCYCNGMVRTLAFHTIGTGPRLQLTTDNNDSNRQIELAWQDWSDEVGLAEKLQTMRQAKCRDGETFGLKITNPRLENIVKLDLKLIEAEQCASPTVMPIQDAQHIDGVDLDQNGYPVRYHILRQHPGDNTVLGFDDAIHVDARNVVHLFREDRPGQRRGVPELTPALPLYAVLRRYTLATLHKAEIAALLAVFLKTTASGFDPADLGDPFQLINLERNAMTTLPEGWDISQLRAEAPTDAHDAFVKAILREIARCIDMPFNIAAGDSSAYNYASGRLDHQTYFRSIDIERAYFVRRCLRPLFRDWLREYLAAQSSISPADVDISSYRHEWRWDGYEHVDPQKEANATETMLATGQTCIPDVVAKGGGDWEVLQEKAAKSLGLTLEEYRERLADKLFGPKPMAPVAPMGGSSESDAEVEDEA